MLYTKIFTINDDPIKVPFEAIFSECHECNTEVEIDREKLIEILESVDLEEVNEDGDYIISNVLCRDCSIKRTQRILNGQ